jgi:hypothetical protein
VKFFMGHHLLLYLALGPLSPSPSPMTKATLMPSGQELILRK